MKLRSVILLVAAAVMALSAAVIGTGTATAATPARLCLVSPNGSAVCAWPEGDLPIEMVAQGQTCPAECWLYNGINHPGQIQLNASVSFCMQLDHNAGNTVIGATCNGASYQKWTAFLLPGGNWSFRSMWDTSQCLTYNANHSYLDTVTCNGAWYQSFVPNPNA